MASEIVLIVTEQRNRQRILLPAAKAPCSFGRGARCDYVLRRNNVGDRQFTLEYDGESWQLRDDGSGSP
ncbi:MAG TPA: FHA domain-containing protein, partial [Candidatus Gemmiger faecigallinarum]|nr:FHA domain-containing protein [Candidatus Gemmiger faecigallinarum]